ncbi:hypothetical protein TNCT_727781 [Trichonephila clavata]|uniref:Uncharacterized protein n=1 Tax=Trichonephila clavata TaxID=2740835 RepID=A0A8X6JBR6_TRICU|nr:hypothetical protein TNCT_727781 [Trichonephila clavata]
MFAVANEMLNRLDEVTTYQHGRYISSSEAVWCLLNSPIHQRDEDGDILEIKPCSTYTEVCQVLRLLEDDSHWYQAMEEAAVSQSPAQLRNLFTILVAAYVA